MFTDGPSPFGKRFQVNSGSLNFLLKPWFTMPKQTFEERMELRKSQVRAQRAIADYQMLLDHEKLLGIVSYKDKQHSNSEGETQQKRPATFNLKGMITTGAPLVFTSDVKKQQ